MAKKIYLVLIKETGVLAGRHECYDSFEKAKKSIEDNLSLWKHVRELRETKLKNEFEVWDKDGNYRHTLQIIDLWVH